jgi:hypothetical protein
VSTYQTRKLLLFLLSMDLIGPLGATDPSWKNKPIAQWSEDDAKQILANSPWVKNVTSVQLPELTAQQRREGGATGGGKGTGFSGLGGGMVGPAPSHESAASKTDVPKPHPAVLVLRWESASPVRVAELKAQELGAPDWQGEYYVIAVYHVPALNSGQQISLGVLKSTAFLKRDGKKDLKPSSVEILQEQSGSSIVVYLFARSEEITKQDRRLEFIAQIGRLSLTQYFFTEEMQFQGKLEL